MSSSKRLLTHNDYTVGWISALPLEMAAAMAMLDDSHAPLPQPRGDHNSYHLSEIGDHSIAIACLPSGVHGITSAAIVAKQMLFTSPSIEIGLMVGTGGGAPSDAGDIRLGDIVVSTPTDQFPGVVQYERGKALAGRVFHRTGALNKPPEVLLTAVSNLRARHKIGQNHIPVYLENPPSANVLFEPSCVHQAGAHCIDCNRARVIRRPQREYTTPSLHYGLIASANQVMEDAPTRDRLAKENVILCYEMEAAGLMDRFPCPVSRGI
ncbi:nucleoside phosphorylase domain-containing protein [Aspergillus recurvatus]